MKKVYGSYLNSSEARSAVDELLEQGFSSNEIKVVSNSELSGALDYMQDDLERKNRR